ncbi:non-homologous end-joining DNA ligase [Pseudonocardia bannensis]|uniref:ATP-dependent DNA ligase n=1 Tax=Pseudonocardia bannensis TaxID=630973 RepID=A0A848DGA1_9PSEU|nr:non-homologous end-joining DNA ligase [Pseudonocardia bannensis]NMH91667.1 ATP-dependent DNA ligase [Pseudonocardia bannensis]
MSAVPAGISHADKVLYPDPGLTKADLARHYARVADVMLPHLAGRPLSVVRFPDGLDGSGFFQKQAPENAPVPTVQVPANNRRGHVEHIVAEDADTLQYLANQSALEVHRGLSRVDALDRPDLMVIDLDPPERSDLAALRRAARRTRDLLDEVGLVPFLMTTGSSGYHVVAPLDASADSGADFDEVRDLARAIATRLEAADPDALTTAHRIADRGGRIYLDVGRNAYGQTAIAPYSPRARAGAPVATPIRFDELSRVAPDRFTISTIGRRLARTGDPWADIAEHARPAAAARERLNRLG